MSAPRKYLSSHPWLTFELDLKRATPRLWMALGEAQSKCHHIAGVPLQPETARTMHRLYLARGLLATTAIEGNTLTEQEVEAFLENKLKLPPSREYLRQEVANVLAGFDSIVAGLRPGKQVPITTALIKGFNKTVLSKLELQDAEIVPGEIRRNRVGVGRYLGAPAEDCEYLLDRLCQWLNEVTVPAGEEVVYGLIKSIFGHIYLAWIHPFGDGNGRTARLMEAKFLLEAGVPTPTAHLLSNHYNLTRTEYYRQLDRASKANDIMGFMEYAVRGFVDQLREQINVIQTQHLRVTWTNYVHDKLSEKTPATRRQKIVVFAMTGKGVLKATEVKQLTPAVAAEYATKTPKTVSRDLNALARLDLVEVTRAGYRAKIEVLLAFLPRTIKVIEAEEAIKQAINPPTDHPQLALNLTRPAPA